MRIGRALARALGEHDDGAHRVSMTERQLAPDLAGHDLHVVLAHETALAEDAPAGGAA